MIVEVTLEQKITLDVPDLATAQAYLEGAGEVGLISRVKVDGQWYAVYLPTVVKDLVYPNVGAQAQLALDRGDQARAWSADLGGDGIHVKVGA